jgi:hypothetical protein
MFINTRFAINHVQTMWEKEGYIDHNIDCMCMTFCVALILPVIASYDIGYEIGTTCFRRNVKVDYEESDAEEEAPVVPVAPPRRSARLAAKAAILQTSPNLPE